MTQTEIRAKIKELEEQIEMALLREVMPMPGVDMGAVIEAHIRKLEAQIVELRKQLI